MRSRTWAFLSVALVSASACTADRSPAASNDSDGDSIPLVEVLRIGGLTGDVEYTFGAVEAVTVSEAGILYVADRQGPVIRTYDQAGAHLGEVGRSGQGPGEIAAVGGMSTTSEGELVVWDGNNARLSTFGPDGSFVRSVPVRNALGGWRRFVGTGSGTIYLQIAPEEGFVESREVVADWARVDPGGEVERLFRVPPEEQTGPRYALAGRGGYYRPFNTATLSTLGPDGSLYVGRNDEYRIQRIRPDGSESVIERAGARIALTSAEKAEWRARSESFAQRIPEQRSDFFPIPDEKPFFRELVTDESGRLWVSRYTDAVLLEYSAAETADREERGLTATYNWRDRLTWDVFGPDDRYLGSVTFPFKTSFAGSRGDLVWGVQAGDYREDYVVVWRTELGT